MAFVAFNSFQRISGFRKRKTVVVSTSAVGMLNTVTTGAYNSACGVYSIKLLNVNYAGAVLNLRASTDTTGTSTQDFYADLSGNLTTLSGSTVLSWVSGLNANQSYAFITKWYDQSVTTTNHATQTTTNLQPVYDITNKVVNFGYSGGSGGYVANYNSNAFFNLPDSTFPYNDSSYSITHKNWNLNSYTNGQTGFWTGGTTSNGKLNMLLALGNQYCNDWWNGGTNLFGTVKANSVITCTYTSGGGTHIGYQDGTSTNLSTFVRSQTNSNNKIGYAPGNSNGYLNGQLYYFYIFSTALTNADRLLIEAT
jgi:hypothetical protein